MNGAIIGLGHGHRVISKAFEIENKEIAENGQKTQIVWKFGKISSS